MSLSPTGNTLALLRLARACGADTAGLRDEVRGSLRFLARAGADVDFADEAGSALDCAVDARNPDLIVQILALGAAPVVRSRFRVTLLHCIASCVARGDATDPVARARKATYLEVARRLVVPDRAGFDAWMLCVHRTRRARDGCRRLGDVGALLRCIRSYLDPAPKCDVNATCAMGLRAMDRILPYVRRCPVVAALGDLLRRHGGRRARHE